MDIDTAIRGRRSIRKYRPDTVPEEVVRQILDEARWAPSWANTQSWKVWVVAGEGLARLKAALRERARREVPPAPDLAMPAPEWPDEYKQRSGRLRASIAAAGSSGPVPFADLLAAPCLLLIGFDDRLASNYASFDAGLLAQTICLAAHGKGLGTCIMARAVIYPDALREVVPNAEGKRFVIGIALGYPDLDAAANQFERERVEVAEFVTWVR